MVRTTSTFIAGVLALIAGFGIFFQGYIGVVPYAIYIEILGTAIFFIGLGLAAIGFAELGIYNNITLKGKNNQ